jgi:hypothetical protein
VGMELVQRVGENQVGRRIALVFSVLRRSKKADQLLTFADSAALW